MSIAQGTSWILTVSSSNTSLQLLSAGQVAFHTDSTELWKDSGLPRMTGHLSGVPQPAGPLGPHVDSTRFCVCTSQRCPGTVSPDLALVLLAHSPIDLPPVQPRSDGQPHVVLQGAQENDSICFHYSWTERGV